MIMLLPTVLTAAAAMLPSAVKQVTTAMHHAATATTSLEMPHKARSLQSSSSHHIHEINTMFVAPTVGGKWAVGSATLVSQVGGVGAPFVSSNFLTYGQTQSGSAAVTNSDRLYFKVEPTSEWTGDDACDAGLASSTNLGNPSRINNIVLGVGHDTNHGGTNFTTPIGCSDIIFYAMGDYVSSNGCGAIIIHANERTNTNAKMHTYLKIGTGLYTTADLSVGQGVSIKDQYTCGSGNTWAAITVPAATVLTAPSQWDTVGVPASVHPPLYFTVNRGTAPGLVVHGSESNSAAYPIKMTCTGCASSTETKPKDDDKDAEADTGGVVGGAVGGGFGLVILALIGWLVYVKCCKGGTGSSTSTSSQKV